MIERGLLQLKEVPEELYLQIKQELGFPSESPSRNKDNGFTIITKPLIYSSFEDVLEEFKETKGGKKASTQRKGGEWFRLNPTRMTRSDINDMGEAARRRGFMYIAFHGTKFDQTNEIGFEYLEREDGVVSTNVAIPGYDKVKYSWQGSNTEFRVIYGIYRPIDIEAYAQARQDRLSRKRRWEQKREKQERRILRLLDKIKNQDNQNPPRNISFG